MKALAFSLAAVGTIAVLLQWAFVIDHWTFLAGIGLSSRATRTFAALSSVQRLDKLKLQATQQQELLVIVAMIGLRYCRFATPL